MTKTQVTPLTIRSTHSSGSARDAELDQAAELARRAGMPLSVRGVLFHYNTVTKRYTQWNATSWTALLPADADIANEIGEAFGAFWRAVGTGKLEELQTLLTRFATTK